MNFCISEVWSAVFPSSLFKILISKNLIIYTHIYIYIYLYVCIMYICMYVCRWVLCCRWLQRPKDVASLGTAATEVWSTWCGHWELNPDPLHVHCELLITVEHFQPPLSFPSIQFLLQPIQQPISHSKTLLSLFLHGFNNFQNIYIWFVVFTLLYELNVVDIIKWLSIFNKFALCK